MGTTITKFTKTSVNSQTSPNHDQLNTLWSVPHCCCGSPMIEKHNYDYKKIINQLEQQLEKNQKDRFLYHESKQNEKIIKHVTWQMIMSKMIGHCFKCNVEFACTENNTSNKTVSKSSKIKNIANKAIDKAKQTANQNMATKNNTYDSDDDDEMRYYGYSYRCRYRGDRWREKTSTIFECSDVDCCIRPRLYKDVFKAERVQWTSEFKQYIRFYVCKQCGIKMMNQYNTLLAAFYQYNPKPKTTVKHTNRAFFGISRDHDHIQNTRLGKNSSSNNDSDRNEDDDSESDLKSSDELEREEHIKKIRKLYNNFNATSKKIIAIGKRKLKFNEGILSITPQCICGNSQMAIKVNIYGMWVIMDDQENHIPEHSYRSNVSGCRWLAPRLHCNICNSLIKSFDPYYSCQFGSSVIASAAHKHGFRVCKYCAIFEKSTMMMKQHSSNCNSDKIDANTSANRNNHDYVASLGKDVIYCILEYAVASHKNITNWCLISKEFNKVLTAQTISVPNKTQHAGDSQEKDNLNRDTKKKEKTILDPRLNLIWKRLVLHYWPGFMSTEMIKRYSNKIDQRWDLFFQIRYKTVQNRLKHRDMANNIKIDRIKGVHTDDDDDDDNYDHPIRRRQNSLMHSMIENCNYSYNDKNHNNDKLDHKKIPDLEELFLKQNKTSQEVLGIDNFSIGFNCPLSFSELHLRGRKKYGYCDVCRNTVVSVESKEELSKAISKGKCVSFVYQYNINYNSNKDDSLVVIKKRSTHSRYLRKYIYEQTGYGGSAPRTPMFKDYESDCSQY